MAHFYVSTDNSRGGTTTAAGGKSQTTHARGWNGGIKVYAQVDKDGRDTFHVYRTGGSNGGAEHLVGVLVADVWTPAEVSSDV